MKTIKNKQTSIRFQDKLLSYGDLLSVVLDEPPNSGVKINEMRERMKILDKISAAKDADIELEDAEFSKVKLLFDAFGWPHNHKDLIGLSDHLEELIKN